MASKVAVLFTRPETVVEDYQRVMELADWQDHLTAERELLLRGELAALRATALPWIDVRARVMHHVRNLPPVETLAVPQRQLGWASMAATLASAALVAGIRAQAAGLGDAASTGIDGTRALLSAAVSTLAALKGLLLLPWRLLGALKQALAPVFEALGRLEPVAAASVSMCLILMLLTIAWIVGNDLRRPWRREG